MDIFFSLFLCLEKTNNINFAKICGFIHAYYLRMISELWENKTGEYTSKRIKNRDYARDFSL